MEVRSYKITYASRIALALQALPVIGYGRSIDRLAAVSQLQPAVLDNYDLDKAERATAMAEGMPPEYLRSEIDRDRMRREREEALAQQQEQEAAAAAAETASKLGTIDDDSVVAKAMEGAA